MIALPPLAQEKRTPGEQVLFPNRPVEGALLAVVDVGAALRRRTAGRRLRAPLEGLGEQVEQGGAVEATIAGRRIGEDREELCLAEGGRIAAEERGRGPLGGLDAFRTVDRRRELVGQPALGGPLLGRGGEQ